MRIDQSKKPLARKGSLIVKEVGGEVLIYDLDRNKAHCLNETAALVWKYCDGQKDAPAIANQMANDLGAAVDEKVVWYALSQLGKDHLLERQTLPPRMAGLNRRDMMRVLGVATAVAVPIVSSIVAPTRAQGGSCIPQGGKCSAASGPPCCPELFCSDGICVFPQ